MTTRKKRHGQCGTAILDACAVRWRDDQSFAQTGLVDGIRRRWYPQRWEYKTITAWDHPTVEAASKALTDLVTRLGQEGWEMVNYTANPTWAPKTGAGSSTELKKWTILIYFKRPIAP